jgi:hypothetical protein
MSGSRKVQDVYVPLEGTLYMRLQYFYCSLTAFAFSTVFSAYFWQYHYLRVDLLYLYPYYTFNNPVDAIIPQVFSYRTNRTEVFIFPQQYNYFSMYGIFTVGGYFGNVQYFS